MAIIDNGNKYRLEVKKPSTTDANNNPVINTEIVHLVLDYNDLENKPLVFNSYIDFPSVGDPNKLYISLGDVDQDNHANKVYRWDAVNLCYRIVGSDWHEITLIDCGGANA